MGEHVTVARDGHLATVTVDRPEKLHALDRELMAELTAALSDLESEAVRVAILRSTGDRAFVAGADLGAFRDSSREAFLDFQRAEFELNRSLQAHPAVTIAAVDGPAYGGGFELVLASNLVVAGESAEFAFPEVTRGLIPGATGGAQWLPRLVGLPVAIELLATGRSVSADEARRLGLVNRVVADGRVDDAAGTLAEELLANAPLAVRAAKEVAVESLYGDLSPVHAYGREVTARLSQTEDAAEGVAAFFEDRDPEFVGR